MWPLVRPTPTRTTHILLPSRGLLGPGGDGPLLPNGCSAAGQYSLGRTGGLGGGPPREMTCPEESARAVLLLTLCRAGESAPLPLLIHLCTRHRFRPENQAANRKVTAPCGSQCGLVGLLFPAFGCGRLSWGLLLTSSFGAQGTKGLLPTAEC